MIVAIRVAKITWILQRCWSFYYSSTVRDDGSQCTLNNARYHVMVFAVTGKRP